MGLAEGQRDMLVAPLLPALVPRPQGALSWQASLLGLWIPCRIRPLNGVRQGPRAYSPQRVPCPRRASNGMEDGEAGWFLAACVSQGYPVAHVTAYTQSHGRLRVTSCPRDGGCL